MLIVSLSYKIAYIPHWAIFQSIISSPLLEGPTPLLEAAYLAEDTLTLPGETATLTEGSTIVLLAGENITSPEAKTSTRGNVIPQRRSY